MCCFTNCLTCRHFWVAREKRRFMAGWARKALPRDLFVNILQAHRKWKTSMLTKRSPYFTRNEEELQVLVVWNFLTKRVSISDKERQNEHIKSEKNFRSSLKIKVWPATAMPRSSISVCHPPSSSWQSDVFQAPKVMGKYLLKAKTRAKDGGRRRKQPTLVWLSITENVVESTASDFNGLRSCITGNGRGTWFKGSADLFRGDVEHFVAMSTTGKIWKCASEIMGSGR